MISQFSVKNYKSIKDTITLDMQAASISEHTESLLKDEGPSEEYFLPVSVIYGPNGSGKSNVLSAIIALVHKVMKPVCVTCGLSACENKNFIAMPIVPFKFSPNNSMEPTEFELYFRTKISEYKYNLDVLDGNVVKEELSRVKFSTGKPSCLFTREGNNICLKSDLSKLSINNDISADLPLLSMLGITYRSNEIVNDIITWFEDSIAFVNFTDPFNEVKTDVLISEDEKAFFLKVLKDAGIEIENYRVNNQENDIEVFTSHIVDGISYELSLSDESAGTFKFFNIINRVIKSIKNGTTLIVDELDSKLHPALLRYVIEIYTDPNKNKNNAQLIFTSHDVSTMEKDVFRRDEIWFVAKGNDQDSILYSLVEFKDKEGNSVRKDASYNKQYLEGKYGADPYFQRLANWGDISAKGE